MGRGFTWFTATALTLGFVFLYLPIVILVIYSFNASRLVTVWGGWSTRWYVALLHDQAMLEAAWTSLRIAAISISGRNFAAFLLIPPPTTNRSGESKRSSVR